MQSSFTTHSKLVVSESCCDGHRRNHIRERMCITSTNSKDFFLKIIGWKNWFLKLLEASKDSQRIQPKPKTQLSRTDRPVSEQPAGSFTQEIGKDVLFGREGTNSRTGRLVNGQSCVPVSVELVDKDEDADENVDADQTRTGRPVSEQSFTQLEEIDIDFRVPGLSHAVVKEAENLPVQELVKKIESHPHREALQADLQQKNVHNPFSNNSKAMIREMGNVELFELCETMPKVQCSHCLLYWNQGIVYCTCGQFLVESESGRKFNKLRLNALSITHYVIKKWRCHGARHGKTEEQKEYQKALNARERCRETVDSQGEHFKGIHDRFLKDQVYRESRLKIGWTEQKCMEMDELAQRDHTYRLSKEEFKRYQGQWYLILNKSGNNAPVRLRSDFRAAVSFKNRLHRESGEEIAEPIYLHSNTGDGTLPQVILGGTGTRPKAGGAHDNFFKEDEVFTADGEQTLHLCSSEAWLATERTTTTTFVDTPCGRRYQHFLNVCTWARMQVCKWCRLH